MFEKTESVSFKVSGMMCGHCVKRVESAIKSCPGIKKINISLENKSAVVEYVPSKVSADMIKKSVEEAGYPVSDG